MKLREIIKKNRLLANTMVGPHKKIAIIGNITLLNLKDIFEFELRLSGLNVDIHLGNYDSLVQDSERFSSYDAVIVFYEIANLVEGLHYKYHTYDQKNVDRLISKVEQELGLALKTLRSCPIVLINNFTPNAFDFDPLRESVLRQLCNKLNKFVETNVNFNQKVLNIEMIIAKTGLDYAFDYRQYQQSKSLYTKDFFVNYSRMVKPAFLSAYGLGKKVLVLDCDNTLWGGILGEDGPNKIQIDANSMRGKVFFEVQHLIKDLQKQGVLLAICSKNNYSEVEAVFKSNQNMILDNEDFVAKRVNWEDKASNLQSLSEELNLGLDSFVFVDDSEFEVGLVNAQLPMIKTILVPKNLSEYPRTIIDLREDFFLLSQSNEDLAKTQMYLDQNVREGHKSSFGLFDDYLSSLQLKINIYWGDDIPIARAAQMTQKTNQFNLTTKRYTEADIQRFVDDKNVVIGAFSLTDQFGDYGVTGLTIVRISGDEKSSGFIDTFLMSCRVIGRNVEYSFFESIVSKLKDMNVSELNAEFSPSLKNKQVENFYDKLGFDLVSKDEKHRLYCVQMLNFTPKNIKYIITS